MRKTLLIMAAALMTMTQCRKQETSPVTPAADTVNMTITAGPGRTDINTTTGAITWSKDDKLYVSDGDKWLGSLTLVGEGGNSQGTFEGSISGIGEGVTTCHFFYLGHDNGMAEPTGTDAASISFAAQDGTIDGATKFHTGYGNTDVTVAEGEAAGHVLMNTKIAIAHINLTTDGTTAYKGAVTMGGTSISNTLSVNPNGTFSGGDDGSITIGNGNGTTGDRYVTLIPVTASVVSVAFTGAATGSMNFLAGIKANNFYGMKDAIAVTLTPEPRFSVSSTTTVEFAPGNLWYGKADSEETARFHFEANQWDYSVGSVYQAMHYWDPNHVSHFFWSKTASVAYAQIYNDPYASFNDVFFTNDQSFQVADETVGTWRTLKKDEWDHLLNNRANASSLHAWKDLGNNVKGLVILPDGTGNPSTVMSSISSTSDLATYGAVFLPAAGQRQQLNNETVVIPSSNHYWSIDLGSTYLQDAYAMSIGSQETASTGIKARETGNAVRLVRE